MRTIKFRGKAIPSFEKYLWVEGFFYKRLCDGELVSLITDGAIDVPVQEETVGQFTGLKDRNGKEIYEGDIVMWGHLNDGRSDETPPRVAIVNMFPSLHFLAVTKTEFGAPYAFHYGCFAYKDTERYLEVIGNVFDNLSLIQNDIIKTKGNYTDK